MSPAGPTRDESLAAPPSDSAVRSLLKRTPVWPLLHSAKRGYFAAKARWRPPFVASIGGVKTRFRTRDTFSERWFYPRYANGLLHEHQATLRFHEEATRARVVVDVGTNLGWFLCIAARANKDASVYGFELDSTNLALCRKNVCLNRCRNVILEHCAVSNRDEQVVYAKDRADAPSVIHRLGTAGAVEQTVRGVTLDGYFSGKPYPEVVKIDVEGAEQLVLEGMRKILDSGTCRAIFVEIHPQWLTDLGGSVREVVAILSEAGYALTSLDHRTDQAGEESVRVEEIEAIGVGGRMFLATRR